MTGHPAEFDIAQRIAEAVSRTSEPKAYVSGTKEESGEVIGSVPVHLRHLHNLLCELIDDAAAAEEEFRAKAVRAMMVRKIFSNSLHMHVPVPKNCNELTLLDNWGVAAKYRSDDDDGDMSGLGKLLDLEIAAMLGRR